MRGSLCISIDMELAWGTWDKPHDDTFSRCAELEESIVRGLLVTFAKHDVSATWAIVARLAERDEQAVGSTRFGAEIWYAPHLIDLVRAAPVAQEVGSHSYAHIYFGDESREAVRDDLRAARRVHDALGLPFDSFVFPRNQVAHVDLLREVGVRVYRSIDQGWYRAARNRLGARAGRIVHLAESALPVRPPTVRPIEQDGIVELPSSMLLMARNRARRIIHPRITIAKARRGLAEAARTGEVFHLWFHPSNFYYDMKEQLDTLDRILGHAAHMRKRGEIEIKPMRAYASVA